MNRWIAENPSPGPADASMEAWTVANSLSIAKLMSWDLADWEVGLELQRAVDRLGVDKAGHLRPYYPSWGPRLLPGDSAREKVAGAAPSAAIGIPIPRIPALAAQLLEGASAASASNAWVIAGSRTRSGRPILANDPHLQLRAPSIWYLAALHGGPIQAVGATIPGLPAVVLGHTPSVAWGFTNAMVDDVDFFVERLDPSDSARYLTPGGSQPFFTREETIRVRGAPSVVVRVRETRHGPVVSDVDGRSGDRVLAMQWTALLPSTSVRAMRMINRARTAGELIAALEHFDEPHQDVVFADSGGTIGYQLAGRIPLRRGGDGLLPAPGWTGEGDWTGFLGFERHPRMLDPVAGFVATANEPQGGPAFIGANPAAPFRAMRLRELLATGTFTTADVAAQQMDVVDLHARRYLPLALAAARRAGLGGAAETLGSWDGEARGDSNAAAIFYVWYEELRGRIGHDEWAGSAPYFPRSALDRILDEGGGAWVDDVRTDARETLDGIMEDAMRAAAARVGSRGWGEMHATRIRSAPGTPAPAPFPAPGSNHTLNVAGYGGAPPFVSSYGASTRHVVDLADPDGAGGFVIPTGQSADPRSPHYRDQTARWLENRLWPIPLDREAASRRIVRRETLR